LKKNEYEGWKIYEDLAQKNPYNGNLPTNSLGIPTLSLSKKVATR